MWMKIAKLRGLEYLLFDSRIGRAVVGFTTLCAAAILAVLGRRVAAVNATASVHRAAYNSISDAVSLAVLKRATRAPSTEPGVLREFIEGLEPGPATQRFFDDP